MPKSTKCRYCGSRLTHLQGASGRVSICSRCGWNRVQLTNPGSVPGVSASLGRFVAASQLKPS